MVAFSIASAPMPVPVHQQLSNSPPSMHKSLARPQQHNDYQKFRPKYPLDPFRDSEKPSKEAFAQLTRPKEPWRLDVDKLPPVELTKLCRTVILVLGGTFMPFTVYTEEISSWIRSTSTATTPIIQVKAFLLFPPHYRHLLSSVFTCWDIPHRPNIKAQCTSSS